MRSKIKNRVYARAVSGIFVIGLIGCNPSTSPNDTDLPSNTGGAGAKTTHAGPVSLEGSTQEHPHSAGNYGGIIVPIGADSYHAEVVVEKSGNLRLIILGKDESRIQEVELQSIKAYVKGEGEIEATPIDLVATPQDGDSNGKTSQFLGRIPDEAQGKSIAVVIPNLKIDGERFRIGFTTANAEHGMEPASRLSNVDERELYLTPGGAYTKADIEVNGSLTASEKFKGIMSTHDMLPKEGDRICPITLTKANPKFTWVVGGKPYQFCCPPCIDEFVKLAKENPDELKEPNTFIK